MRTKDYSKFKFSKENREIKTKTVNSIKESMKKFGFITGRPVLINTDGIIVDGQHRFLAAKDLGIEIEFEIITGDYINKMIELNSTQSNWTLEDYVNSYASQNIDCYRKLLKFQEKYDLSLSSAITIFFGGVNSSSIRKGENLKIRQNAEQIADFISNCHSVPYNKDNKFIRAIVNVYEKLTKSQLNRLRLNLIVIPKLSNANDFVIAFENVINKGKKGIHKVYLSK
jgi:ribosomal protein L18E